MRRTMVPLVAVAALGLGGCGAKETRLSQEEFVRQGNAICKTGSDRIDAAAEKAFAGATGENPPTDAAVTAFAKDAGIPEIEKQLGALDDLRPPKATETKFDQALAEARRALAKAKANPSILADDSDDSFEKANGLIKATGLDTCAE